MKGLRWFVVVAAVAVVYVWIRPSGVYDEVFDRYEDEWGLVVPAPSDGRVLAESRSGVDVLVEQFEYDEEPYVEGGSLSEVGEGDAAGVNEVVGEVLADLPVSRRPDVSLEVAEGDFVYLTERDEGRLVAVYFAREQRLVVMVSEE